MKLKKISSFKTILTYILESFTSDIKCHAVYANNQGPKNRECQFYHGVANSAKSKTGQIIQLSCQVKFHFYLPNFDEDGKNPSSRFMAILNIGEHTHPPPPPRKIPQKHKQLLLQAIQEFGLAEATARRLISSPILPLMLDGKTNFGEKHVSLINHGHINHLIQKEKVK